jgi:peptidoglycan/xylan/chitin deacetylase (PgdA/CDA1 family)
MTGPAARRLAMAVAGAAVGVAVAQAGPGITGLAPVRRLMFPRLSGQGNPDHVALTFDDGPDPSSTPHFLQVLADHDVRATFFMLGSMVQRHKALAADVAAAGHELAVHGWDHRYLPTRTPRSVWSDLLRATDLVGNVAGYQPQFFRPPYGVLSGPALLAAGRLGLAPVLWRSWGREWTPGATAESVYATLADGLAGGVTVLLHDTLSTGAPGAWQAGLGALPMLLAECSDRGLAAGPLSEHGLETPIASR